LKSGGASVRMLASWKRLDDGSYNDPTTGSATSVVSMTATATPLPDTAALGKPERINLIPTLDLDPALVRADLVAAAVRKSDGVTFYDYDLALPAKVCDKELATACLPERVILLSCAIRDGQLHVLRVEATAPQWRNSGTALRLLRSSFDVEKQPA